MASVSKLSIRGVRAFSPHDEEQVVEFFFPCTIIVGRLHFQNRGVRPVRVRSFVRSLNSFEFLIDLNRSDLGLYILVM